ncbi:MAG: hypothetical protein H0W42_10015 [Gemmatimonadaceae bacterium]|nr:hypothetical protein [Gemmatimonadaceae bacterium]
MPATRSRPFDGLLVISRFPNCGDYCWISVRLAADSARGGADAHVARILRAEAIVDSINRDPRTILFQFHDYHGPPLPVGMNSNRGIWLAGDCGDCTSASLFVAGERAIAEIEYSIDSRQPYSPRLACRLGYVAQTFRWRGAR